VTHLPHGCAVLHNGLLDGLYSFHVIYQLNEFSGGRQANVVSMVIFGPEGGCVSTSLMDLLPAPPPVTAQVVARWRAAALDYHRRKS